MVFVIELMKSTQKTNPETDFQPFGGFSLDFMPPSKSADQHTARFFRQPP